MTTVSDIVELSLKDSGVLGVGQTPLQDDLDDCLMRWNMMIGQWAQRRWLVYHLVDTACVCTGQKTYSVGPGGDFDIARPDRIEAAYIRQLNPSQVDWPLFEIKSREDYSLIALKNLRTAPSAQFFYDSDFPQGFLYPWPIPNSTNYELHILTKGVLSGATSIDDEIVLPLEYEEALYYNFMLRLRIAYRLPLDKMMMGMAKAGLNTIRRSNFQVGSLKLPTPFFNNFNMLSYLFGGTGGGGGGTGQAITTEDGFAITTESGQVLITGA